MEEADAIGDRIAIMNEGNIVCHGTAMFLKKVYGKYSTIWYVNSKLGRRSSVTISCVAETGYHLTVMKREGETATMITNVIKSNVTEAVKLSETDKEIVYKLPLAETNKFANLFKELEERKQHLGIANMGVTCTTMEQVFLKYVTVFLL